MGIAQRPQDTGDEELRLGILLPQHAHEGYAAAQPHIDGILAEKGVRGIAGGLLQPGGQFRGIPAGAGLIKLHPNSRAIGWIGGQRGTDGLFRQPGIHRGRQAQGEFEGRMRTQDVARRGHRRYAVLADHAQGGAPGTVENLLGGIVTDGP